MSKSKLPKIQVDKYTVNAPRRQLKGTWTVETDYSYIIPSNTQLDLDLRSGTNVTEEEKIEAGLFYCPYIPLIMYENTLIHELAAELKKEIDKEIMKGLTNNGQV